MDLVLFTHLLLEEDWWDWGNLVSGFLLIDVCTRYYGYYTNIETHCTWGLSLIALCLDLQTDTLHMGPWDYRGLPRYIPASSTSNDSSVDISLEATRLKLRMY